MRRDIGIAGLLIVVAMMLAMVPNAAAQEAVDITGQLEFENGTPCGLGIVVCVENLNETIAGEPWCEWSFEDQGYAWWDYLVTGQASSEEKYIKTFAYTPLETQEEQPIAKYTTPDDKWYGEKTAKLADVRNESLGTHYIFDIVLYEQELPIYTISGYTDPAADTVKITNLNKQDIVKDRSADYIGPGGFYNLTLNVPDEVEAGNVLQITACDEISSDEYKNESNCNVSTHEVVNAPGEDTNVNLTLDHYCLNYHSYPYRTWEQTNWSGPAVMQMMFDHYRPEEPSQSDLNATGIAHNQQDCNANLSYVDPLGMQWTLNDILHNTSTYGGGKYANYGIGSYDDNLSALHYICYWQHLGPGAAPAYGDYSNWMAIRGIHTSEDPYLGPCPPAGNYDVYGLWMNDPKDPGGIGEKTYKTVDQWTSEYYFNLSGVRDCDDYLNKYVAVCEPPEQPDVEVKAVHSPARLEKPVDPKLMGLDVVKAAIDGVNEELVPYDSEFAEVFAKTIAGEPMLVTDDDGNEYYLVPFEVPVEKRPIPFKKPVEIQKFDGRRAKVLKLVDGKAVIKPVHVRPIRPIKEERTLVVVLVDAEDGSFKEASWVADPVKYLSVSKREALRLVFKEMRQDRLRPRPFGRPVIELVHRDASPYSPDWKITIGQMVFYVSQDGTVSYDKPAPTPTRPPRPIKPGPIRIMPI